MILFAFLSLGMSMAACVPLISNSVNAFLGLPQLAQPDKPDRSTHLFFLLFCYSSPLLLSLCIGLLHSFYVWWHERQNRLHGPVNDDFLSSTSDTRIL